MSSVKRAADKLAHGVKQMHANLVVERGAGSYVSHVTWEWEVGGTSDTGSASRGAPHTQVDGESFRPLTAVAPHVDSTPDNVQFLEKGLAS